MAWWGWVLAVAALLIGIAAGAVAMAFYIGKGLRQ